MTENTVTVNTDASFCPHTKAAGYAFWISCNGGRYKKHGVLKGVKNPGEAEMHAIANALHYLYSSPYTKDQVFSKIWINSDCLDALSRIQDESEGTEAERFIQIRLALLLEDKGELLCRHVRAHRHTRTPRNYVNDWCDTMAKKSMRIRRKELRE